MPQQNTTHFISKKLQRQINYLEDSGVDLNTSSWAMARGAIVSINEAKHIVNCFSLLRDLADLQNGPPLEQHKAEWEDTMNKVYELLNQTGD